MTIRHIPLWRRIKVSFGPVERWAVQMWGMCLIMSIGTALIFDLVPLADTIYWMLAPFATGIIWFHAWER